jgi:hypothetical protein
MGLTPLKRAILSGELLMTYKIHNLQAPPPPPPPNAGTKLGQPNNPGPHLLLIPKRKTNKFNSTKNSPLKVEDYL